jgi:hypothetical protein
VAEAIEKAPDAAIDAMNATLRRMHKMPPKHHSVSGDKEVETKNRPKKTDVSAKKMDNIPENLRSLY